MIRPGPGAPDPPGGSTRVVILAPRCWGKTHFIIRRAIWEVAHNPNQLITIVSCDDDHAINILREIKQNIVSNRNLHVLFPKLRPGQVWQNTQAVVQRSLISKDPTFRAAGLFSTGVGGRAHLMFFDDVVSWRTTEAQPQLIVRSKQVFHSVWMRYLLPGGRAVVVGTPWHVNDLNMDLVNSEHWVAWRRPALVDGESTWPEMWPTEELLRIKAEDEATFQTQYMLDPLPLTEHPFNFTEILDCVTSARPPDDLAIFFGVDVGVRIGSAASYSVIFVLGVDRDGNYWTVDVFRARCSGPELMQAILDLSETYKPQAVYIENNAFQQALIDFIEASRTFTFDLRGFTTTTRKHDPAIGIPPLARRFRKRQWLIPHTHPESIDACECGVCVWIRELAAWPGGKYSDTVMAMWLATRAAAHYSRGLDHNVQSEYTLDASEVIHEVLREEMEAVEDYQKEQEAAEWKPAIERVWEEIWHDDED